MRAPLGRPIAGLATLILVLVGCSDGQDEDEANADGAADDLAASLEAGDFADLELSGATSTEVTKDYATTIEEMGGLEPTVSVEGVEVAEDGDTADVTLAWSWPVADEQEWAYETEAELTGSGSEWAVTWDRSLVEPSLTETTVLDATTVAGARGDITGVDGRAIVTNRPVVEVGVDRSQASQAEAVSAAEQVAAATGIDPAPYVKQVRAAGDEAFVLAITYRVSEVPPEVSALSDTAGVLLIDGELPLAPTRDFAAPILGTVGDVTAEMIKEHPDLYEVGDQAGLSGLQARYDEQLRGTSGVLVQSIDDDGTETELFRSDAAPGKPLALTMNARLQSEAESLLAGVGPASAIVAIRPSDGAILAAANGPGNGGQNLATYGQYAPGSTFKAVSSLALLRAGVTPDTTVSCPPTTVVDGKSFKNYSDYPSSGLGQIPFRAALANSCNTAFIGERGRLKDLDLFDAAAALGMGVDHDLGFPAFFGSVEPAESETEGAANMIGQGRILASPMTMAAVIASVQEGKVVVPRLLESVKVTSPDHEPMSRGEADALRGMLRGVVTSGSGIALADVPGPEVIAKTGTAEFQGDKRIETHAWMIAAQGDLAVAVFVELGQSGSSTAGPILEQFLRAAA
ncbi:MAG TPA: penicillin-binding transpeptidase domain-containing protein [Nocardioides sp.]|nr:penicillin-binding transpeptidase domain-containing protein [Nocardioides sp.]